MPRNSLEIKVHSYQNQNIHHVFSHSPFLANFNYKTTTRIFLTRPFSHATACIEGAIRSDVHESLVRPQTLTIADYRNVDFFREVGVELFFVIFSLKENQVNIRKEVKY